MSNVSETDAKNVIARCIREDATTLNELRANNGLSPERVRQIEQGIIKVVQAYVLAEAPKHRAAFA